MKTAKQLCFRFGLVLLLSQTGALGVLAQDEWVANVSNQALPAVITIISYDKQDRQISLGSGFIIGEDGLIVTNYHVIREAHSAEVRNREIGQYFVYGVVAVSRDMDFAILKIRSRKALPTLALGDSSRVRLGEGVVAIGNPKGLTGTISTGVISQVRDEEKFSMFQTSAPIYPGNSGGPLLNRRGEVIGLVTARLGNDATLGFALPSNYLRRALRGDMSKVYGLSQLAQAESVLAAEEAKEELKEFIKNNFEVYEHPRKLFNLVLPKNWVLKHEGFWSRDNQVYFDETIIAPKEARLAELNGYLSDGIRVSIQLPKEGNVWTPTYLKDYIRNFPEALKKNNPGFALTDSKVGEVAKMPAAIFHFVGQDRRLPEPEKTIIYILPRPEALVKIELVTPTSKLDGLNLLELLVKASFELKPR